MKVCFFFCVEITICVHMNRYLSRILTEQEHSVFLPLRSLTTPSHVSKQTQPLSNALPEPMSPKHSLDGCAEMGRRVFCTDCCSNPVASDCDLWCVFFGAVKCFSLGEVIFWSLGRSSSDRIRFFSIVPCDFFFEGRAASEL